MSPKVGAGGFIEGNKNMLNMLILSRVGSTNTILSLTLVKRKY